MKILERARYSVRAWQSRVVNEERVSLSVRRKVYGRAHKRCEGCRKRITSLEQMNAHHLRRFVDGGPARLNNLACLCKPCHRLLEDWGKLLGDAAAVSAMLDRLLHHGHVLKCGPWSWRTKMDAPGQ